MKTDKSGKYRVNLYLNPDNIKDMIIVQYLNQRYSAAEFIKETLYSMAMGNMVNSQPIREVPKAVEQEEYFEPIDNVDDIEI